MFAQLHQLAYVSVQATRLCLASRDNRDNVYQTLRCLGHQRGVAPCRCCTAFARSNVALAMLRSSALRREPGSSAAMYASNLRFASVALGCVPSTVAWRVES